MNREEALQKLKSFCAYQPRCNSEAREKLQDLGLSDSEGEKILEQLVKESYLSEERYAVHFARGRFRIKNWGRLKIKFALFQKQVNKHSIEKGLAEIDEA